MTELGLTQAALAARGGPSTATVRGLLKAAAEGKPFKEMQHQTCAKFDTGLQLEPGSTRDFIAGGDLRPVGGSLPATPVIRSNGNFLIPPPELAEALKAMSPAERAEAEARMWAEAFKALREMRGA